MALPVTRCGVQLCGSFPRRVGAVGLCGRSFFHLLFCSRPPGVDPGRAALRAALVRRIEICPRRRDAIIGVRELFASKIFVVGRPCAL